MKSRWMLIASIAVCVPVFAQQVRPGVSISLSPPFIEKLVRPGSSVSDTIALTNNSDLPVMVSVDFSDFRVNDKGEVEEIAPGIDPTSLSNHIRMTPLKLRVPPQGRAFFKYTVDAPEQFRQLRSQIFFSSQPIVPNAPNQVLFVPRMGVPIYIENINSKPADVKATDLVWGRSAKGELQLTMHVSNEGERNIRPKGTVEVRSADGKFNETFPFNSGNEPVLPGQKRVWTQTFGVVPDGELSVRLRFETSPRTSFEQQDRVPPSPSR